MDNLEQQVEARLNELSDDELNKLAIHLKVQRAHEGIQAPLGVKIRAQQRKNFITWVKQTGNIQKTAIYLRVIQSSKSPTETEQESFQKIIEALKNFWEDKDFEAAKSTLPPAVKTYDILCRFEGQRGAKTTNAIRWLGEAANNGSGYCPALLDYFANPEVIADLEKWQEKPAEKANKQDKATTTSQSDGIVGDTWTILGIPINVKKLCTKLKSYPFLLCCCLLLISIIVTYPLWHPLINKTDHNSSGNTNIGSEAKTSGDSSPAIITSEPNSPVTANYDSSESKTKRIAENKFSLLPKEIFEEINSRPVYQQKDARKYYIGSKVKWPLYLSSIHMLDEKTAWVFMRTQGGFDTISCFVEISRYPQLKRVKGNSVIWVSGEIETVGKLSINLCNVSLDFE